jgi:hypothetical protein
MKVALQGGHFEAKSLAQYLMAFLRSARTTVSLLASIPEQLLEYLSA